MLFLRQEQMDMFQSEADTGYADKIIKRIRQLTPEIVADDSDDLLRSRVTAALPVARRYGIHGDISTMQIATLAAAIGPAFLDSDNVKRFFEAPGPSPDDRVDMLCELLSESL